MFERIASSYKGKTVAVIGAGGIGAAIVESVAQHAAAVIVGDYDAAPLERLHNAISKPSLATLRIDVRRPQNVQEFFEFVKQKGNGLDYFFYTAGLLTIEPLLETRTEAWDRVVDVNLNGTFYCVRAAGELMAGHRRGSILLLGSIAGTKARSGTRVNPVYNATKAAVAAFVNSAAMHLRPHGVRINSIAPGPTATSMMDVQPNDVHTAIQSIMLDGRMNEAREVAEVALFVAAHGRFTGEDVPLGGGAGLGG